jgi:hypothetical protein
LNAISIISLDNSLQQNDCRNQEPGPFSPTSGQKQLDGVSEPSANMRENLAQSSPYQSFLKQ